MINIAIIGTTGKGDDLVQLNESIYLEMLRYSEYIIMHIWKLRWNDIRLVSGASPWADHQCIDLYLKHKPEGTNLLFEMPCGWNKDLCEFLVDKELKGSECPGAICNLHHRKFSTRMKRDSLQEIQYVIENGASWRRRNGFSDRNRSISELNYIIAYTFGMNEFSISGTGIRSIWKHAKTENKIHVSIPALVLSKIFP